MMATQRVSDLTMDELNQLIDSAVDRRLQNLLKPHDSRSQAELLKELDQLRFNPPEGAKSSLELLREDRDK
ncbi:MAG: hypothetical protein OHK0046_21680 [Anaerolineae bacterium]